jgi:mono/diheme cytochrome c family protein
MRSYTSALTLFLAPFLVPSASAAEKLDPAAAAKGKLVYERYCASCHGKEGRGDGPVAAELRTVTTDLTRLAERNGGRFPFEAVVKSVDGRQTVRAHGAPDMPIWGEVFPKTGGTESPSVALAVSRITHYIWSLQTVGK